MNNTLAQRLRSARGKIPQAEFAARVGIHKSSWGRYERGEAEPTGSDLAKICLICGVEAQWLLLGQGPMRQGEAKKRPPHWEERESALVGSAVAPGGSFVAPAEREARPWQPCPRCIRLEEKLDAMNKERRELSEENRHLWKENGQLREGLARSECHLPSSRVTGLAGTGSTAA